jgi:hypothetical protein
MNNVAHGSESALAELLQAVVGWIRVPLGGKRHTIWLAPIRDRRSVGPPLAGRPKKSGPQKDTSC